MIYDRAEELGKSTVWHGVPLSLALFQSFGPAIRVQDGIKKVEVLYLCESQRTGRLFFFPVCCSISLSFSHTVHYFFAVKGRGNRPTKERKGGKKLCRRKKQTSPKKKKPGSE